MQPGEQSAVAVVESSPAIKPPKKSWFWAVFGIVVVVVFGGVYVFLMVQTPGEGTYTVVWDGTVSYTNRPVVRFERVANYSDENVTVDKLFVESKGVRVAGLLAIPKNTAIATEGTGKLPAFLVMPGAGTSKEGEHNGLGRDLNELGFATLTIDLRGSGETGGELLPVTTEVQLFKDGKEVPTHQSFYDVLRAFDALAAQPDIDKSRIAVIGESLGGRYAIIAGGMEPRITGVVGVSTAGLPFQPTGDVQTDRFLASVNPDTYLDKIPPRELLMMYSANDGTIAGTLYTQTYQRAGEPKERLILTKPGHGYDRLMGEWLGNRTAGW